MRGSEKMNEDMEEIEILVSHDTAKRLEVIQKKNPDITTRYILQEFIKEYCSTNPKGIKIKIKELENDIKELENNISVLHEDKIKKEIELKTYRDKSNNKDI